MSNKPNRLGALIQTKGAAERPVKIPQRGEPDQKPAAAPVATPEGEAAAKKSLTLKLSATQYKRLRAYSFANELSHQQVMETALMRYLDQEGG